MNEDFFMMFGRMPEALPLYQAMEAAILNAFPDARRKISKTQVSFSNRYGIAFISPPVRKIKDRPDVCLILTFGLGYRLENPRIVQAVEPYPGRWTHHVLIAEPGEMDEEVLGWLREAWNFSMNK